MTSPEVISMDNKHIFRVGVTGGIGSGKTSVCRVFKVLGIPVFSADMEAQKITESDQAIREEINAMSGRNLYTSGHLDRHALAELIFNNKNCLEKINSLIHPVVFENFNKWILQQTSPYVIMEAAILFESGAFRLVDKIITVEAPVNERVERVGRRSNLTGKEVLERIKNQMDDESKIKLSDYVIHNSEHDMIIPAILRIHEDILNMINSNT